MRISVVLLLLALLSSPGAAETAHPAAAQVSDPGWQLAAVIECRDIIGVVQRLGCYDAAVGGAGGLGERYRVKAVAPRVDPIARPVWRLEQDRDPFGETERSSARLERSAGGGEPAAEGLQALRVECDGGGGWLLSVLSADYLGAPGQAVPMRFRFGDGAIVQEVWQVQPKGTVVAMPGEGSRFLAGLQEGSPALIEVITYRGHRLWARFPAPEGGPGALDHLLGACQGRAAQSLSAAEGAGGL